MINIAYAMAPQANGGTAQTANPIFTIGFFILMILIFYFFMIRPSQQKEKKRQEMLSALQKGDMVITGGGIYGKIVGVENNKVVLKIAENVKVEFSKNAIVGKVNTEGKPVEEK